MKEFVQLEKLSAVVCAKTCAPNLIAVVQVVHFYLPFPTLCDDEEQHLHILIKLVIKLMFLTYSSCEQTELIFDQTCRALHYRLTALRRARSRRRCRRRRRAKLRAPPRQHLLILELPGMEMKI